MIITLSDTLCFRFDEETNRELESLTAENSSRNAAVVDAIHDAYRNQVYERVRRESEALRDNPEYQAEVKAAREAMGSDDAW
ncbi:MAG TPA: hypothetical protein VJ914_13065 [Pseudonocardiaceae bacterium]|nr:hypothetical protein [Pseudonocardiaceae bacterium]